MFLSNNYQSSHNITQKTTSYESSPDMYTNFAKRYSNTSLYTEQVVRNMRLNFRKAKETWDCYKQFLLLELCQ